MVERDYEYALTPSSQFYFCGLPFRLDVSPKCSVGCKYCFSIARGGNLSKGANFVNPKSIENKLHNVFYR